MLDDIVDRVLRQELVGERADRREWLWHRLWELDRTEEFPIWLFGVVDVALWDLEGRVLGVPVHRLLGTYRESIPAYASTVTFSTAEEYLDVADQCLELGFPAIKLHAWGDARADAELCQRLRAHVGADVDLMYDGSAGFDLPSAVYLGRRPRRGRLPLVRGADARVQRDRVPLARRARRRTPARRRDVRREPPEHRRLHRFGLRHVRQDERQPPRRHHRRHADRAPRRLVPAPSRGARADRAGGAPLHGDPQLHLLRVARDVQPGERASRASVRTASSTPRRSPASRFRTSSTRRAPERTPEGREELDERSAHEGQASVARAGVARRGRDDGGRAGRCLNRRSELRKGLRLDHRLGRRRPACRSRSSTSRRTRT